MRFLLILLLCVPLPGCRRKKTETPVVQPPPPVEVKAIESVPPPAQTPPATVSAAKTAGPHLGEPANPKEVKAAYHQYFDKTGNFPNGWPDMVSRKFLPALPQGKNGQPLDFVQFTLWEAGRPAK